MPHRDSDTIVYSFMHGRLADNILLVVEEICAVDQMTWSQYSIGR